MEIQSFSKYLLFWKFPSIISLSSRKFLKKCAALTVPVILILLFVRAMLTPVAIYREKVEQHRDTAANFDQLLYHVQHPRTLCATAISLGGVADDKGQVDGDKIVCQDPGNVLRPPCIVYSFGGNDEWSFEEAVGKIGCSVHTFDPSLKHASYQRTKNIWFHRMGISHFSEDRFLKDLTLWSMRTLEDIVEGLGHETSVIDVLKLDIEGDEWKVLENILESKLFRQINHLCVEVHLNSMDWARKLRILRRLEEEAGFRFFSSRKNLVTKPRQVPGIGNRSEQLFYELGWFRS